MQNKPTIFKASIRDVTFGENVKVVEPCNVYECTIGNNVFIGPFVEIQKGVVIGNNTKVQSHAFICELVTIGDNCFIGHGVMFVNDLFSTGGPARGNKDLWMSTKIGNNVSVGSNVTLLPVEIVIGDDSRNDESQKYIESILKETSVNIKYFRITKK